MTEAEQVEAIRKIYPRRVAPEAARKMIARAAARLVKQKRFPDEYASRRFLYKKAAEFALSPAGQPVPKGCEDYRPYPATWFNAGHYDNDPAEWQKPNGGSSNGRQNSTATKAERTIDAVRAAVAQAADHRGAGCAGDHEGRRVQPDDSGDVCGRTIEGTVSECD